MREIGEKVYAPTQIEPAKTKDLGDGVVEVVVTTPSVDRYNESILTEGIDIQPFLANPVVLYGHDYDSLPIGKALNLRQMKTKLKSVTQFAVEEYPFAKTVYELVKGGYLNDVSIGGLVKKWSDDYRTIEEMEMVEYSHVNIGANRDAKVIARCLGKNEEEIGEEIDDFVGRFDSKDKNAEDPINQSIRVLRSRVDALEAAARPVVSSGESVKRITHVTLRKTAADVATQTNSVIRIIKMRNADGGHSRRDSG